MRDLPSDHPITDKKGRVAQDMSSPSSLEFCLLLHSRCANVSDRLAASTILKLIVIGGPFARPWNARTMIGRSVSIRCCSQLQVTPNGVSPGPALQTAGGTVPDPANHTQMAMQVGGEGWRLLWIFSVNHCPTQSSTLCLWNGVLCQPPNNCSVGFDGFLHSKAPRTAAGGHPTAVDMFGSTSVLTTKE